MKRNAQKNVFTNFTNLLTMKDDDVLDNQISIEEVLAGSDLSKGVNKSLDSIVDSEDYAKVMTDAKQAVVSQKSPQKKLWSFIFMAVNIIIVFFIILFALNDNEESLGSINNLINVKKDWLFLVIVAFVVITLTEAVRIGILIYKSTKSFRPFLSYKTAAIGKYYDFITPLASGGQPFQIYYLTNRGIKASSAISIPLARYIVHQICYTIFALFMLIGSVTIMETTATTPLTTTIIVLCWIGFGINFFLLLATILISSSSLGQKIVILCLKLAHKLKIVKDYDTQYYKLLKTVREYQRTMKFFVKSPMLLIYMLALSTLCIFAQYSIPYFIYCGLGGEPSQAIYMETLILALTTDLAASFTPLPGGSGTADVSFCLLFASIYPNALVVLAYLIWRIATYYGFILQGLFVIVYDYIRGNRKNEEWLNKRKQAEEERLKENVE